jgi:AcrR family transcriptional regulator
MNKHMRLKLMLIEGERKTDVAAKDLSRRDLGKKERRTRIVNAAYDLLREAGVDALSVIKVAEPARVSPATVYNLFGTKGAILAQLFDQDLKAFRTVVGRARAADALDHIFKAVSIAAGLYKEDPGFYRATMHMRPNPADPGLYAAMRAPRIEFWRGMVRKAGEEGFLKPDVNSDILGVLVTQIASGVLTEWVSGIISAEQLERETCYGFAIALMQHATPKGAKKLAPRIAALEKVLAQHDRRRV